MASTPLASPQFRSHSTLDFDSPANSDCSVIFGAEASPVSSKPYDLTPLSRRDTLVLVQGFAGLHNTAAERTNNGSGLLTGTPLAKAAATPASRSRSPLKQSQTSSVFLTSPSDNKENRDSVRRSVRRRATSPAGSAPPAPSPSRPLRFSNTPKSTRKRVPVKPLDSPTVKVSAPTTGLLECHLAEASRSTPSTSTLHVDDNHAHESHFDIPRRYVPAGAIGYDSDELTDADAEGSIEIWSDEDEATRGQSDTDVHAEEQSFDNVVALFEKLDVDAVERKTSPQALWPTRSDHIDASTPSAGQILAPSPIQPFSQMFGEQSNNDPDGPVVEVEDPAARGEPSDFSSPIMPISEEQDEEGEETELDEDEREGEHESVEVQDTLGSVTIKSPPRACTVAIQTTPALPQTRHDASPQAALSPLTAQRAPRTRSPVKARSTPMGRAATTTPTALVAPAPSTTPSAADSIRRPTLAAPTARRQLTKLTARKVAQPIPKTGKGPIVQELGTSAIRPAHALQPIGSAPALRSSPRKPASATAPPPSSLPSSASRGAPTPSIVAVKKHSALPVPSSISVSRIRPAGAKLMARPVAPLSRPSKESNAPRPPSAASGSSSSSSSTFNPNTNRIKPVLASTVPTGAAASRQALSSSVAARKTSAIESSSASRRPMPASTKPVLATTTRPPLSGSTHGRTATAFPRTSRLAKSTGATRLPAHPASGRPKLPALGQTHSAPAILIPDPVPAPVVMPLPPPPPPVVLQDLQQAQPPHTPARAGPLLPRPMPVAPIVRSPDKRVAQRVRDGQIERSGSSKAELVPIPTLAHDGDITAPAPSSQTSADRLPIVAETLTLPARRPFSPVKNTLVAVEPLVAQSTLTAPAEKVDAATLPTDLFPSALENLPRPTPAPLPRPTRANRIRPAEENVPDSATRPAPTAEEPVQLLPRPTRRSRALVAEPDGAVSGSTPEPDLLDNVTSITVPRSPVAFKPAPALTQDELNRLTQRNTSRNQLHFNKLDVQTVYVEANRPPSPTSRIRRSISNEGSLGRPTTKEGREARAAKRRSALRSSTDGSELALMASELGVSGGDAEAEAGERAGPAVHHRAPGDEEEFFSPVRPIKTVKAAGKQKSVTAGDGLSAGRKRVKWDKALVYEGALTTGPLTGAQPIIKRIPLDAFGNSTATAGGFAKPVPVQITKMVYRDD